MSVPDPLCPPCETRRSKACRESCEGVALDLLTGQMRPCTCACQAVRRRVRV